MSVKSINVHGTLLSFDTPKVMGILNATPDSFYNKGTASSIDELVDQAFRMKESGASIIDIGGMSSRPKADFVSIEEEIDRVIPVIEKIKNALPDLILSIDSFRSKVAKEAMRAGVGIVNDISSGDLDEEMLGLIAHEKAVYICMHMQGTPSTMQLEPKYDDVTKDVYQYLQKKLYLCREHGIKDVIIDPGFGFGKTVQHNYQLLNELNFFSHLNAPILVGISRKSMITNVLETTSDKALNGTSAAHMIALTHGANILRVHDVKEAMECIKIYNAVLKANDKDSF